MAFRKVFQGSPSEHAYRYSHLNGLLTDSLLQGTILFPQEDYEVCSGLRSESPTYWGHNNNVDWGPTTQCSWSVRGHLLPQKQAGLVGQPKHDLALHSPHLTCKVVCNAESYLRPSYFPRVSPGNYDGFWAAGNGVWNGQLRSESGAKMAVTRLLPLKTRDFAKVRKIMKRLLNVQKNFVEVIFVVV